MNEHAGTDRIEPDRPKRRYPLPKWVARLGVVGFAFFFIKGLLWLLVGSAALTSLAALFD